MNRRQSVDLVLTPCLEVGATVQEEVSGEAGGEVMEVGEVEEDLGAGEAEVDLGAGEVGLDAEVALEGAEEVMGVEGAIETNKILAFLY